MAKNVESERVTPSITIGVGFEDRSLEHAAVLLPLSGPLGVKKLVSIVALAVISRVTELSSQRPRRNDRLH